MTQILRMWWPIFAAMALIQAGNGVTGTLISVTSEARAFAPWLKGLVLSAFYAGSVAGAFFAPAAIARSTHVAAVAGFILVAVAATAGYALSDAPMLWIILRFMAGFGLSGAFAAVESWLSLSTKDDWRARVFSIYLMVQLGGLAAGQLLLNARGFGNELLFVIASVLTLSAVGFLRFEVVESPHFEAPRQMGLSRLFRRSPFGVSAVVLSGYAWAALMASGPALVESIGLSDFAKSIFMTLAILSGVIAQFPVASLADHRDRRLVLAAMAGVAALATLAGLVEGALALLVFAVAFGAATFPLYAVGVARVSERLEQSERTAASASMIVYFLMGAIVAPPLLAYAIALFGPHGYFIALALPHAGFAIAAALTARPKAP
jgi:MFS family permease